jgi:hypothetical protein
MKPPPSEGRGERPYAIPMGRMGCANEWREVAGGGGLGFGVGAARAERSTGCLLFSRLSTLFPCVQLIWLESIATSRQIMFDSCQRTLHFFPGTDKAYSYIFKHVPHKLTSTIHSNGPDRFQLF